MTREQPESKFLPILIKDIQGSLDGVLSRFQMDMPILSDYNRKNRKRLLRPSEALRSDVFNYAIHSSHNLLHQRTERGFNYLFTTHLWDDDEYSYIFTIYKGEVGKKGGTYLIDTEQGRTSSSSNREEKILKLAEKEGFEYRCSEIYIYHKDKESFANWNIAFDYISIPKLFEKGMGFGRYFAPTTGRPYGGRGVFYILNSDWFIGRLKKLKDRFSIKGHIRCYSRFHDDYIEKEAILYEDE